MKKSLLLCALLSIVLLAGCTTTNLSKCPKGSEYKETFYDNGNIESQGCLTESNTMEGHWIYYFENGGKDVEGDMVNNIPQGERIIYDEDGQNIVRSRGFYKDGMEEGEWKYYDDDGVYVCADVYSGGRLTDRGNCNFE